MRWNGGKDNPLGNPQSRGLPTWFIVPEQHWNQILKAYNFSDDKNNFALNFLKSKRLYFLNHCPNPDCRDYRNLVLHEYRVNELGAILDKLERDELKFYHIICDEFWNPSPQDKANLAAMLKAAWDNYRNGPSMLKTTYEGKELIHRHLWEIVETEAKLANEREQGWRSPTLVAMVFAFHAVEAYLNYVGEQLAPEIWKDERNFFRKEPYRGWDGKLRKVMELVNLPWPEPAVRPLKTILELKRLRDLIAHGKSERLTGEAAHASGTLPPLPSSTLLSMITPRDKLTPVLPDVEQFLDQIHSLAAAKTKDIWFGESALRGPLSYSGRTTSSI
jgi:hypothetical protein